MSLERQGLGLTVWASLVAASLPFAASAAWAAVTSPKYVVSQLGRTFHPQDISIRRGDTVQFVNDDGDLLHHAYVESDKFNFDSGDLKPGSKTDIAFTEPGRYVVLCAIHPKMKLIVHVQ